MMIVVIVVKIEAIIVSLRWLIVIIDGCDRQAVKLQRSLAALEPCFASTF